MKYGIAGTLAASVIIAAAGGAKAQDDTVADDTGITPTGIYLDPITVFATLSPMATFEFPGQVTVVEREELETEQANSIQDVLENVPGVFVDGGTRRSGQAPTIRGFREEDILILVDGVKQSFVSGHDGRIFIDPSLLKTAEVVKGPLSAIYGSGALGGVIALTTVDAADFLEDDETMGYQVKGGFQSANDEFMTTSTGFARSVDGKYDSVASFTYRNGGDIRLGSGTELPEDEEIKSSLLKATRELAQDLKFTGTWIHYQDDSVNPNNPQPDASPSSPNPDVLRYLQSDTISGKLSYAPTGNPWIDGNFLVYRARHLNEEDDTTSTRFTTREVETTGVNLDNRSRFSLSETTNVMLTYGAEYYIDRQTGTDNEPQQAPCFPPGSCPPSAKNVPDADASYYGTFLQAEIDMLNPVGLPGELKVIPGVRWDGIENNYKDTENYEDYKDQAISPKLGLSYKPAPWLLLFGNYGSAFRAPSYTELYAQGVHFQIVNANVFEANPELQSQEGETLEGGIGFDFQDVVSQGDRFTVKGSYWQTDATNFIDLLVVGANPASATDRGCFTGTPLDDCYSQFINIERAELDGVEIEAKYDADRWFVGLNYTHIDGLDKDTGDYLGIIQPDKIVLDAGLKVPEIWSRFGTRVTFADEFTKFNPSLSATDIPEGPRDAYNLVDLYATFEPEEGPWKGFRLDLGVDNVADEAYEVIAQGVFEEGVNYKAAIGWTQKW